MSNNIRGNHVSPGIYTKETDLAYASKSLGITTLALVGETLKGPAFEPVDIKDWNEFQDYFGATSAEKFKESNYPKYELPYVAKAYLEQSQQLKVCRVLGLSGYNAGTAWAITVTPETTPATNDKFVIAIVRSRGKFSKYGSTTGKFTCDNPVYNYDELNYFASTVDLVPSKYSVIDARCDGTSSSATYPLQCTVDDLGHFTLSVNSGDTANTVNYGVSFNPGAKDYILNILGSKQEDSDALIYVEELYDVALEQMVAKYGKLKINGLTEYKKMDLNLAGDNVEDILNIPQNSLKTRHKGKRFIADSTSHPTEAKDNKKFAVLNVASDSFKKLVKRTSGLIEYEDTTKPADAPYITVVGVSLPVPNEDMVGTYYRHITYAEVEDSAITIGGVYEVKEDSDLTMHYYQSLVNTTDTYTLSGKTYEFATKKIEMLSFDATAKTSTQIFVESYQQYFMPVVTSGAITDIQPVACDFNDYKEQFRFASTPWFVSELKGDTQNLKVNKLFRFHTISDGNAANEQVKVSIANVDVDNMTFDVIIRGYYDADGTQNILERYNGCTMLPGSSTYIGLKIGTLDGEYVSKSKYVTVEIMENDATKFSVPCGFLGYPMRNYNGAQMSLDGENNVFCAPLAYNTTFYEDTIKTKNQFFGLSDLTGIDLDVFNYKGVIAYGLNPLVGYTPGFHLDSTVDYLNQKDASGHIKIDVDGVAWYFDAVSAKNLKENGSVSPTMGTAVQMEGSIYEDINVRKFTAFPYGGFDGWDVYRGYRSNTDDFKASRYKGKIINKLTSGSGKGVFSKMASGSELGLKGNIITSDYYAYLAGALQFENPAAVDINVFATPGIDYVNNELLVKDIITMIEDERADSVYIVTTPDKRMGAGDTKAEMYSADDVVANLADTNIDTSYAATYYPWVQYFDSANNRYIMLPPTKDVVRDLALTDNISFPWKATAGIQRGPVECEKPRCITKTSDEDVLYGGRINPIKSFSSEGVKIWGNKTLYTANTPLNRLNTRRLMIRLKKLISIASLKLVFEQNDATVENDFKSLITPIFNDIKQNRGLSDYRIKIYSTPETRDEKRLPCRLWVKPTNCLEYIELEFMITPEGVDFGE